MGKLPHIASMIYNQPLLITEEKLYEILGAIGPRINLTKDELAMVTSAPTSVSLPLDNTNGLAIIPIEGTLTHRPMNSVSAQSGLMSYQEIQAKFDQALNDPQINTILLNINSNGGQVNGCFDLVDHIYNSRDQKDIIAISNESAYSSAYAIGSAAKKFYVTRTAGVGSIGVIAIHQDISKKLEKDGVTHKVIKAGKHKDDLSPLKPLTKEVEADLQNHVNEVDDLFVSLVSRNRNIPKENIFNMEARTYNGQKAVDLGLADKVTTYDNVINTYGGNNMELQAKFDELNEKFIQLQTKYGILQEDLASMEKAVPDMIEEATELGRSQEMTRVMAILEKCTAGKKMDLIEDLVKNSNTPEQAAALIMQSKSLESKAEQVSSAIKGNTNAQEANVLVKNAEKRSKEYLER